MFAGTNNVQCDVDPDDPLRRCIRCLSLRNPSLAPYLCYRARVTDIRLFKPGQVPGYEWTQRWDLPVTRNDIDNWASTIVHDIQVSEGYSDSPMQLTVRQFVPQASDKLDRTWVHYGIKHSVRVPPFAVQRLSEVKSAYESHMKAFDSAAFGRIVGCSSALLSRTYLNAFKWRTDPSFSAEGRHLLDLTLKLWLAVRFSTRSVWIVGRNTLGMSTKTLDETSRDSGKIPLPPVMGAQLDHVLIHEIQAPLRRELLALLDNLIRKSRQRNWLAIYLAVFILLHNAALLTAHDAAYAKKHGMNVSNFLLCD